ncbi:MAG: peptide chain release factor N(5)-glutamine methyltransferase, partial [Chloroflexota bacterium]
AHPEFTPNADQVSQIDKLVERFQAGEPLPYLLKSWEFYGINFLVTPDVMIPRPETELLVETAIAWLRSHSQKRFVADVGTGSGCIAVALAKNIPDIKVFACDRHLQALNIARRNAQTYDLDKHLFFTNADLIQPFSRQFDLICANLPYIPTKNITEVNTFSHEPSHALDGGVDGLQHIRQLLKQMPTRIASPGLILLEIEASAGKTSLVLAEAAFPKAAVHLKKDLAERDRLIMIQT